MTVTVGGYFWVCTDCMLAHANGEDNDDRPADEPEPWALWPGDDSPSWRDVAMGGEHDDDCTARADGEDCECERQSFSWAQCDGCGSYLGGERHAFCWFVPSPPYSVEELTAGITDALQRGYDGEAVAAIDSLIARFPRIALAVDSTIVDSAWQDSSDPVLRARWARYNAEPS